MTPAKPFTARSLASTYPPDFGNRLRAVMGHQDVNPAVMAQQLGVTPVMIHKMRHGKTLGPEKSQALAAMFPEAVADYLFGYTNILPGWRP